MPTLSESFLPTHWDECESMMAQCQQKAAQLSAQGLVCTCLTLYRITDGMPVYVVDVETPESESDLRRERASRRERPSQPRSRQLPIRQRGIDSLDSASYSSQP